MFRSVGNVYMIHYGGAQVAVKYRIGTHYLCHLLHHPRHAFKVLELVALCGREKSGEKIRNEHITHDNTRIADCDADLEILDQQAEKEYQQRLDDLNDQFEEAKEVGNIEKMATIEEERDWLYAELTKARGFQGHRGTMPSNRERARTAVRAAITRAINDISLVHPLLGQHLRESIKTGATCSYNPSSEPPPSWSY
jgi:hypothetical protein